MNFNEIVQLEASRGRAIFSAVKASGGTITAEMRLAISHLNNLARDAIAGEEMDQSDAALAVNLADMLTDCADRYQNGKVWAFAVRAYELLGEMGRIKVMLLGIFCMIAVFSIPSVFRLSGSISLQVIVVAGALLLLGIHSFMCAGSIIGNEKVGLIREFLATLFMLTPVFAAIMVIDYANTPRLNPGGSVYSPMFVSFFFAQGVVALVLGYLMQGASSESDQPNGYEGNTLRHDDFPNMTPLELDPNYSPTGMGLVSQTFDFND